MNFVKDMPEGYYWCRAISMRLGVEYNELPYIIRVTSPILFRKKMRREVIWWIHGRSDLETVLKEQNNPVNPNRYTRYELIKIDNPFDKQV